ncbi:hypothetical protein EYZ11_005673 [Aspergillus tanneri]|uniref:Uncharacterized protein n=1 Tax=Aspergillus tanneri TaxID=1220188 RepID=A0A4S3JJP8_9EURO|nr:hypothetical protein EYZ11_005673 [Aspergillus tanneri]
MSLKRNEISAALIEATELRRLHESIFIPIAFVCLFFGMNTKEINNSSCPTKYYAAAALPLTAVTLCTPLSAVQLFTFLIRLLKTQVVARRWVKCSSLSGGFFTGY